MAARDKDSGGGRQLGEWWGHATRKVIGARDYGSGGGTQLG